MSHITSVIIKIFVVGFGLAIIFWGISALGSNSSSWPSVQAKVLSSESNSDEIDYTVTYEYQVDNIRYTDTSSTSDQYRTGDELTVYYDPASPSSTITSRGEAEYLGVVGILFGLFCVGGVGWEEVKTIMAKQQKTEEGINSQNA